MNRFFPLLSDADKAEAERLFLEISGEGESEESSDSEDAFASEGGFNG